MKSSAVIERYLNDICDMMSYESFASRFCYLTTKRKLANAYYYRTFGRLLRRLDPIAFYQIRNDSH